MGYHVMISFQVFRKTYYHIIAARTASRNKKYKNNLIDNSVAVYKMVVFSK